MPILLKTWCFAKHIHNPEKLLQSCADNQIIHNNSRLPMKPHIKRTVNSRQFAHL